jgi:gluconolactonase
MTLESIPRLALLLALAATSFAAQKKSSPDDQYVPGPDSKPQPGVPKGEVLKFTFDRSTIFPGTTREYFVYVPRQYDPARPACLMVFQDGNGRNYEAPTVFDNLIHRNEMPVTIAVMVMHGRVPAADPAKALDRFNRSYEYDGLGDNYARFLIEELLPDVEKRRTSDGRAIRLSKNATDRAIAGSSSGGIAAWTAAWERPDAFSRVFTSVGTYVGLRGGDAYPILIRKFEPRPIRVFLQDGSNDNNIYGGDWWIMNQAMERSFVFAGYEINHVWGEGGHNGRHATAIFPDAMRWLWKNWPTAPRKGAGSPQLQEILLPGEDWLLASGGHQFTEGPAANAHGEVFFSDIPASRIHKIGLDGKVTLFAENTGNANGLMFAPDGRLFACAAGRSQLTAYTMDGKSAVIASDVKPNDLAINQRGDVYFSEPGKRQIGFIPAGGTKRVADTNGLDGLAAPNGVRLSPDQTLLLVADYRGRFVWSYQVQPDGSLAHKQAYHHLHLPDAAPASSADGMTVDTKGRLYVATAVGIQVCDQAGRVNCIIPTPNRKVSNVAFGGPKLDTLYATCGDKVYRRKTQATGVLSWQAPVLPPKPRL